MKTVNDRIHELMAQEGIPSSFWARQELSLREGRLSHLPAFLTALVLPWVQKRCREVYCEPGLHGPGHVCPYCGQNQDLGIPMQLFELTLTDGSKHLVQAWSADDARHRLTHGREGMALVLARARQRQDFKVHPANIVDCRPLGSAERAPQATCGGHPGRLAD